MPTFTQAQVDAFKQTLIDRKGARSIALPDGQTVVFDSYDEALKFLGFMERNLDSKPTTSRTRLAAFDKGV